MSIEIIRRKLDSAITRLCEVSWMFSKHPEKDFTRNRKLPFRKMISILLAMEGGSLTSELLRYFGCSADTASSSAFVQQREKINADAFPSLFDLFVEETDANKLYKGLRLIAADGSDIQIPTNPYDSDSYFPGCAGQAPYNLLHLDAMYDLLQHTYTDAIILGQRKANERSALRKMIERSQIKKALLILDRGYESYNLMAHAQEKGWHFLIRIQDVLTSRGIAAGLNLPDSDEFDVAIDLALFTKQTNELKKLFQDRNHFKRVHPENFDFLPKKNRKYEPVSFYPISFRIVRFKITEHSYETIVTNLDDQNFPPDDLKMLYSMRWGIETSFRELKYTIGLLHFHAKKVEYIHQEIFARLIMYNFAELVTSHVIISVSNTKFTYKANFTVAVHACRQLFLGNVSPPDVEATIRKHKSPICDGRSRPRKISAKHAVSFTYRIA